jgi:hypothetical protein
MKKYYVIYPRNFANEYTLVSVETPADEAALKGLEPTNEFGSMERITAKKCVL